MNTYKMYLATTLCLALIMSVKPVSFAQGQPKASTQRITTIIFDLDGVLFQQNKQAFAKKIGLSKIARHTLTCWCSPSKTCLKALHEIGTTETDKPAKELMHRGKTMPKCIVDWQLGHISHEYAYNQLLKDLDALEERRFFGSKTEREITESVLNVILDPTHAPEVVQPVTSMITMAKKLKEDGYRLFVLANLSKEHYDALYKTHSDIIELFEDVIVSSQVGMIKPHKNIYRHFLATYQLEKDHCLCIDHQPDHIKAAKHVGIAGIVHKNDSTTKSQLLKLGIRV